MSIQCGGCGKPLDEPINLADRPPCPDCGSPLRTVNVSVADVAEPKEQVKMAAKDPSRPGKQKIRIEQLVGDDQHRKSGKWYKKVRVIDRENNLYLEEVADPETGAVIHRCEEPLSDHTGHGSAKGTG